MRLAKTALSGDRSPSDDGHPRWLQPVLLVASLLLLVAVSVGAFALVSSLGGLADTLDRQQRPPPTVTMVDGV